MPLKPPRIGLPDYFVKYLIAFIFLDTRIDKLNTQALSSVPTQKRCGRLNFETNESTLLILDILHKWNYMIFILLCLFSPLSTFSEKFIHVIACIRILFPL